MPGNSIVGTLRALLTLDSAQFESGLRQADKSLTSFAKNSRTFGRQATDLGVTLAKGLTLPILAIGGASAKAAIDFEDSFTGVQKTVNATEAEFAALSEGFRELATEIPVNVNELNRIGEAAGQLGIETENILEFTEVMAKLGVTTNLTSEQAATAFARFANITNLPQNAFENLGSTVVALGNNFETTESEITDFALRIAGAGEIAGLTESDILAIGAAMSSVGIQAEAGGTAVQKVLNQMTASVAQGGEELEIFAQVAGQSAADFAALFERDAAQAFRMFVEGLAREGDNAFQILDDLKLGNERVIRAFLSLANAGDLLNDTLGTASQAWEENAALTREAELRFETTTSQLTLLWNAIRDIGITIGNSLLPLIKSLVGFFRELLPLVEGLADAFSRMSRPFQALVVGFAGLLAAVGPVLIVIGQMSLGLSGLAGAFTKTGVVAKAFGGTLAFFAGSPVAATIAVLAGAGGLVWALTEVRRSFDNLNQSSPAERLNSQIAQLEQQLEGLVIGINATMRASGEYNADLVREAEAIQKALVQLRAKRDTTGEVTDKQRELAMATTVVRMPIQELGQSAEDAAAAFDALVESERELLNDWPFHRQALDPVLRIFAQVPEELALWEPKAVAAENALWQMAEPVQVPLAQVRDLIGEIGQQLDEEPPPTFFGRLVSMAKSALDDLNRIFMSAFEGGGGLGGAIQSLATKLTESFLKMIPVVGQVISQFAGAIVSGFKALGRALFGGPSEQELEGRKAAQSFRDGFSAELSATERINIARIFGDEADHATFLAGMQQRFMDLGLSADEAGEKARQFGEALFAAEVDGEEAVANVVLAFEAEIEALEARQAALEEQQQAIENLRQAEMDLAEAQAARQKLLDQTLKDGAAAFAEFADSSIGKLVKVPEAFAPLVGAIRLAEGEITGPLIAAAIAGGKALASLNTMGELTGETFAQTAAGIKAAYFRLIAEGATAEEAMEALREPIAQLIKAQYDHGFAVDDGTQRLIDQGVAYGITAEEGETAADKQLQAFDALIEKLEELLRVLREDLPAALSSLPDAEVNVRVTERRQRAEGDFQHGTRNLDFQQFGRRTIAALHGTEAVIPQGTGHVLAAEIARAMPAGGGGMVVQNSIDARGALFSNDFDSQHRLAQIITDAILGDLELQRRVTVG